VNNLDIISTASTKLGKAKVQSLDEGSFEADVFGQLYEPTKQAALASYDWSFNKFTVELSRELAAPTDTTWAYRFLLPSDYVSGGTCIDQTGATVTYAEEAGRVLRKSQRVFLKYTRDLDEREFPPLFTHYLIAMLAYEACEPLVGDGNTQNRLAQEIKDKFAMASSRDAIGKGPQTLISQSRWQTARYGVRL